MNAKLNILGLAALVMVSASASADVATHKPSTRIDFNRMINENNNLKQELKKNIDEHSDTAAADDEAERAKVTDFVDVEVGWGEAPAVVDRRFDSVDEN